MLSSSPFGGAHLAVIAHHWNTGTSKGARELINHGRRRAVDDAGPLEPTDASACGTGFLRSGHNLYPQAKVFTVRWRGQHKRIAQAKPFANVLPDARCGGRRQREHRRIAQPLTGCTEPQIGRSEVVTPFGNAVGFVHTEKRGSNPLESGRIRL